MYSQVNVYSCATVTHHTKTKNELTLVGGHKCKEEIIISTEIS